MAMNMRGSLNVSRFQKTPAQPRFYGKALIHGVEYTVKGWEKDSPTAPGSRSCLKTPCTATRPPRPRPPPQSRRCFQNPCPRRLSAPRLRPRLTTAATTLTCLVTYRFEE